MNYKPYQSYITEFCDQLTYQKIMHINLPTWTSKKMNVHVCVQFQVLTSWQVR